MATKLIRLSTIPGSLRSLLKGQLRFMSEKGFDVIGVSSDGEALKEVAYNEDIRIIPINMARRIAPIQDLKSLWNLWVLFRKEKPVIVHSITPKAGLLSMLAAKMAGVPIRIHTFTGLVFPTRTGVMQKTLILMDKLLCWAATNIYPEGNGVRQDLINYKITSKPLKVIANGNINGIDLEYFSVSQVSEEQKNQLREHLGIKPNDFVFIFVGRLVSDKGINELIKAFSSLKFDNVKLLLVGPMEKKLDPLKEETLRKIETNPSIIAVGFQKDVRPYFAISNVLAFPSYREGFPNVVIQAGAMELPCIVSNINGCNEIIIEGENGLIIPPKQVDDLQKVMKQLIESEIDYLPSAHGSSIFTRGETQSLTTVTLGTSREANVIDLPTEQSEERFYLHYNFPPFSTGEARPLRGTSRREIGHGNLAQRALKRMIPDDCPYTVRVVSEILESNGSSSMATVCAGTLALMDAGVQMKKPVSGIAMGLITDGDKYAVLSDILGDEDHLGDMDFKVTGTKDGITACQMDIKIKGLTYEILEKALEQAREGRLHILGKITETIAEPKATVKAHAPKIVKMEVAKDYIGAIIGSGGKNIQGIQQETGTTIVIEEVGDLGVIEILGVNPEGMQRAVDAIKACVFEPVEGEVYTVKITKLLDFGAVVEFVPGKDSLLHISEMAWERTEKPSDILREGDIIEVKYLGIDPKTRKTRVSRKVLLPRPPKEDKPRHDKPKHQKTEQKTK